MRVLLTGWPSFLRGEATAGDVLSMDRVHRALQQAGLPVEVAWSPVLRSGSLHLDDADPDRYTHLVFACGPAHGEQVRWLHARFDRCCRIAVGVTVIDPADPSVTGFDRVMARDTVTPDGEAGRGLRDLSSTVRTGDVPVIGVILAPGQPEYGLRRRHSLVHERLTAWLAEQDCARIPIDTRLDPRDWRHAARPDQLDALLRRLDVVVTTRLHGLVLPLRYAVPVLAVDPVAGRGKVGAQAGAWDWPALVVAEALMHGTAELSRWWQWCLSAQGRAHAAVRAAAASRHEEELVSGLLQALAVRRYVG
ncbi:MAG TPA: polysaccharide pyruvyl transferase family protein [Pseudonocardiaceae bacterium]|nr:polysaccharide pyruvyl transferase family protein [Pseudonocardiaceae bacterium]